MTDEFATAWAKFQEALNSASPLAALTRLYWREGIRWKIYRNPMRDDSVFIAEDKERQPIGWTLGECGITALFPATPDTPHRIPFGICHALAEQLLERLNQSVMEA